MPFCQNLVVVESSKDIFTPTLTDAVDLDFIGKDVEGNPCSPEGILKQNEFSANRQIP